MALLVEHADIYRTILLSFNIRLLSRSYLKTCDDRIIFEYVTPSELISNNYVNRFLMIKFNFYNAICIKCALKNR